MEGTNHDPFFFCSLLPFVSHRRIARPLCTNQIEDGYPKMSSEHAKQLRLDLSVLKGKISLAEEEVDKHPEYLLKVTDTKTLQR